MSPSHCEDLKVAQQFGAHTEEAVRFLIEEAEKCSVGGDRRASFNSCVEEILFFAKKTAKFR